jgi:glycosyltransferase involved in cell wall biosynthesis
MARVLMLLSNPFRPDPRVHKEAKALTKAGNRVTILCWDRERKHQRKEMIDGIGILRFGPRSAFSEPLKFMATLPMFWCNAINYARKREWDIIHCHDLDTLPLGIVLTRRKRVPLVYDSHEIYSSMVEEAVQGALLSLTGRLEKWLAKKPGAVICVNDRFADILGGWGVKRPIIIMGCPEVPDVPRDVEESVRKNISPDGKPVVLYIGMLEPHRNQVELARGFAADKCPGAILVMGGFGSLAGKIKAINGKRFKYISEVKPADLPAYNQAADILVAVYDPKYGNNRDSVPNKLFEAMSAGKPIVVAKGTWTGETVEKTGCGLMATYGTDEVFGAIDRLLSDSALYNECAKKGRDAYEREYNWPNMEKRLLALYDDLLIDG